MAAEDLEWERSKISNQDVNTLKRLGLMKKEDAIRFPSEESYPNPPMEYRVSFVDHLIRGLSTPIHDFLRGLLFVYGIQLHQLTPNSILHISIFITLCECFLGIPPNWALWKRIFYLRRNGSHNATYNIGGVVICVRTDVDYFDVKFLIVQGWRKRWLYIHEESANSVEHNIVPFDGSAKIQRRRSWDAEASEEKKATEALMSRIHQLQNTRGKELSGVQITAYFLKIRVQPLQARKNPLWTYSGENDANRISSDLSAKDLEKLIRRISRLAKKDPIPSSCRVEPYSSANPLPRTILLWLPFLLFLRMEKSKNRLSLPKIPKVLLFLKVKSQPMIKELLRIGSQFIGYREYASRAEEKLAEANKRADALAQKLEQNQTNQDFDLENPVDDPLLGLSYLRSFMGPKFVKAWQMLMHVCRRCSPTSSEERGAPDFPYPCQDVQFTRRPWTEDAPRKYEDCCRKHFALVADSQQTVDWTKVGDTDQIEQSRWRSLIKAAKPNTKKILAYLGIKPASTPSSSRPELVFDNYTPSSTPSNVSPSSSRSKRTLADATPVEDSLPRELDELRNLYAKKQTLVMMEKSRKSSEAEKIALQQAREAVAAKEIAASEAEKATTRENFMLELMNEASSFTDAVAEEERVNTRTNLLVNLSLDHGSLFWATPERTRQIVRFQDLTSQTRDFLDFCTKTLSMVYNSMFPRNVQPKTLPELMEKFKDAHRIHDFVRAQLVAGARFALIMLQICHSKLDLTQVVAKVHEKVKRRRVGVDRINTKVSPIAEEMIEDLLRMDADFFADGHYADFLGAAPEENRVTLDNILNHD
ncbi:hypothetical protein QYE76_058305 [Lolium multiflorum]|uniref:Transposase (putative) gypsy type domain-containing protein n=1 Tax=Lolium multiflorum TaxID=4521 RepID=A0AAD8T6P0_LOLMU|nr:hypothetical protein QYE76_058305 [Lolium multiflorum]